MMLSKYQCAIDDYNNATLPCTADYSSPDSSRLVSQNRIDGGSGVVERILGSGRHQPDTRDDRNGN